jgi:hypothetical protein
VTIEGPDHFRELLEGRLAVAGLPEPIVHTAGAEVRDLLVQDEVSGALQARFRFPFQEHGYVVGEDDLDLLTESFQLSSGAAMAGFGLFASTALADPSAVLGVVQVGFNLFRTVHRFRRKAVRVTRPQYSVVAALKAIDAPATATEVRAVLGTRGAGTDVEAVLQELSELRAPDGTTPGFVVRDGDGRWRLVGI